MLLDLYTAYLTPINADIGLVQPINGFDDEGSEIFSAILNLAQGQNTISINDIEEFLGSLALTQPENLITINAVQIFIANLALVQGSNHISINDLEQFSGTVALLQAKNLINIRAQGQDVIGKVRTKDQVKFPCVIADRALYSNVLQSKQVFNIIINDQPAIGITP